MHPGRHWMERPAAEVAGGEAAGSGAGSAEAMSAGAPSPFGLLRLPWGVVAQPERASTVKIAESP